MAKPTWEPEPCSQGPCHLRFDPLIGEAGGKHPDSWVCVCKVRRWPGPPPPSLLYTMKGSPFGTRQDPYLGWEWSQGNMGQSSVGGQNHLGYMQSWVMPKMAVGTKEILVKDFKWYHHLLPREQS